jgi:hypothetical protein
MQEDALRVCPKRSLEGYRDRIHAIRTRLVAAEAVFLQEQLVSLVITDVSALCLPAARKANITSVVLSNFTWDFMYSSMLEVCYPCPVSK